MPTGSSSGSASLASTRTRRSSHGRALNDPFILLDDVNRNFLSAYRHRKSYTEEALKQAERNTETLFEKLSKNAADQKHEKQTKKKATVLHSSDEAPSKTSSTPGTGNSTPHRLGLAPRLTLEVALSSIMSRRLIFYRKSAC